MADIYSGLKGLKPITGYGNPNIEFGFLDWCYILLAAFLFIAIVGPAIFFPLPEKGDTNGSNP